MLSFVLFCFIYYTLLWLFDQHKPSKEFRLLADVSNQINLKRQEQSYAYPENVFEIIDSNPAIETFVTTWKLHKARTIARQLNITQKENGKDKNLAQFQRDIRQKLIKSPALLEVAHTAA